MLQYTVSDVMIVRLSVSLIARLITLTLSSLGDLRKYSRIRSNTITVSFIENPITVSMAAMKCWSISSAKGTLPRKKENTARVTQTSCSNDNSVPSEYCHLRKRSNIYRKIAISEITVACIAPLFRSSEIVGNTVCELWRYLLYKRIFQE